MDLAILNKTIFDEIPTTAKIDALDTWRFGEFFHKMYQETLPESKEDLLKILENMNLATSGCLNLAGLLLFGKKPELFKPELIIKAVRFLGNEISDRYQDSEDFNGPLAIIFQNALNFIMRNLKKLQGEKSVNSLGDPEIPQIVFEELLVNALIHRDYFITAPIRLFVFENRIEIINPGYLANHLTIAKIKNGNSVQRNPILASFAAKGLLPYRGLGTGVIRALKDWPKIELIEDRDGCQFKAIIYRQSSG